MPTLVHRRVCAAQKGENQTVICKMPSGWAVLGDTQFIRGYCLLLPDPVVLDLNDLQGVERTQFLNDMVLIGDALLSVTDAFRINYELLGNYDPALHAHIFPRYMNEEEEKRQNPIWVSYDNIERGSRPFNFRRDKGLMEQIAHFIQNKL